MYRLCHLWLMAENSGAAKPPLSSFSFPTTPALGRVDRPRASQKRNDPAWPNFLFFSPKQHILHPTTTTPTILPQSLVFPCTFFIHLRQRRRLSSGLVYDSFFTPPTDRLIFCFRASSSPASHLRLLSLTASSRSYRLIYLLGPPSIDRSQTWALPAKPRLTDNRPTIRRGGIQTSPSRPDLASQAIEA